MRLLYLALAVLLAYTAIYSLGFPNNLDTVSHLSTVMLTTRDGFAPYTTAWYAGSPILVVYALGFWIAHLLATLVGPVAAYLLVDFAAVAAIAFGAWRVAGAMGFERERREWLLLLLVASPAFFYSWIRVDRFPTLVGAAFALFAIEQALLSQGRAGVKRTVACAALLGLTALANPHVALIAAIASAYFLLRKASLSAGTVGGSLAAGAVVGGSIAFPIISSIATFLPYSTSTFFSDSTHSPIVLLSWLGPLVTALAAWAVAEFAARRRLVPRKIILAAFAIASAASFFLLGFGKSPEQVILLVEFIAFLAASEFLKVFQEIEAKADFNLAFAAILLGAALTHTFGLPLNVNPVIYVLFAAFFASFWIARHWLPTGRQAALAVAMVLLSIPAATIASPAFFSHADSVAEVTAFLSTQNGFGRVLYADCPFNYYYSAVQSGIPSVGGAVGYTISDPLIQKFDLENGLAPQAGSLQQTRPARAALLNDDGYGVKWVVSCFNYDYSQFGFNPAYYAPYAIIWEKPVDYKLVQGAAYEWNGGNEIILHGHAGDVAQVNTGYYPSLACDGCEFVGKGTHSMQVKLLSNDARIYARGDLFTQISFSVVIALLALVASLIVLRD